MNSKNVINSEQIIEAETCFQTLCIYFGRSKKLLKLCGLSTIETYSSTEKAIYNMGDHQNYLVAEKQ